MFDLWKSAERGVVTRFKRRKKEEEKYFLVRANKKFVKKKTKTLRPEELSVSNFDHTTYAPFIE